MTPKYNALAQREPCEQCGAKVAEECIGERGERIMGTHYVRRRVAGEMRKARTRARREMARAMTMRKIYTVAFLNEHDLLSFS